MSEDRLIKAPELSMLVDTSIQAITAWYRWKELHPDHELAQLLPDYITQEGGRRTRYWHYSDVVKLIEFKNAIPKADTALWEKRHRNMSSQVKGTFIRTESLLTIPK